MDQRLALIAEHVAVAEAVVLDADDALARRLDGWIGDDVARGVAKQDDLVRAPGCATTGPVGQSCLQPQDGLHCRAVNGVADRSCDLIVLRRAGKADRDVATADLGVAVVLERHHVRTVPQPEGVAIADVLSRRGDQRGFLDEPVVGVEGVLEHQSALPEEAGNRRPVGCRLAHLQLIWAAGDPGREPAGRKGSRRLVQGGAGRRREHLTTLGETDEHVVDVNASVLRSGRRRRTAEFPKDVQRFHASECIQGNPRLPPEIVVEQPLDPWRLILGHRAGSYQNTRTVRLLDEDPEEVSRRRIQTIVEVHNRLVRRRVILQAEGIGHQVALWNDSPADRVVGSRPVAEIECVTARLGAAAAVECLGDSMSRLELFEARYVPQIAGRNAPAVERRVQ